MFPRTRCLFGLLSVAILATVGPFARAGEPKATAPLGPASKTAAAPDAVEPKPGSANTAVLPLKKVVLFSSGVGFFEHAGQVRDNAKVEFNFRVENINDLLKSMVVQDLDGGQV
ncbi:MAG: hypothetical protein NUV77_13655, partial [Thermoguttaceae bacterium]|nr:hypothetical protein [Thermoguttaceae bacterium]